MHRIVIIVLTLLPMLSIGQIEELVGEYKNCSFKEAQRQEGKIVWSDTLDIGNVTLSINDKDQKYCYGQVNTLNVISENPMIKGIYCISTTTRINNGYYINLQKVTNSGIWELTVYDNGKIILSPKVASSIYYLRMPE